MESQGLIRQLSFGNLVLLQPELLDAYASALVNSVRDEPDGLGSILEEKVRTCDFTMPTDERIADIEQEKLLLIAMVEDMLRYEIGLREQGDDGAYLVFPSQSMGCPFSNWTAPLLAEYLAAETGLRSGSLAHHHALLVQAGPAA